MLLASNRMPFRAINYKFRIPCLKITHPKLIVNCTPNHAVTTTNPVEMEAYMECATI